MESSKRFSRKKEDFKCEHCGNEVRGTGYTDHCPKCLYSKHVDLNPGDRKNPCRGLMRPTRSFYNRNSFIIEYKCEKCKGEKRMAAAENDNKELLFKIIQMQK